MNYEQRVNDLTDFVKAGHSLGEYPGTVKGLRVTGYTVILNGVSTLVQLEIRIGDHLGSERWMCDGVDYTHIHKCKSEREETEIIDNLLQSLVRHLFFRASTGLETELNDLKILYKPCKKMDQNETGKDA